MKNRCARTACTTFMLLTLLGHFSASPDNSGYVSQSDSSMIEEPGIACSPERPTVLSSRGTVRIKVWLSMPTKEFQGSWQVTAGVITPKQIANTPAAPGYFESEWNLSKVDSGDYTATVTMTDTSGTLRKCSARVLVTEPLRDHPQRETGRSFLFKGKVEQKSFGLYSYLLFGSPPTASERQRYLQVLVAYLGLITEISKLQDYFPSAELNITYLPLDVTSTAKLEPEWILNHYDYARARDLLSRLDGDYRKGPYIISSFNPLSDKDAPLGSYLFQDLSTVPSEPKDLVAWWIREFLSQAAQEHYWEKRTGQLLMLRLRTTIAVLSLGFPEVRKSLDSLLTWKN